MGIIFLDVLSVEHPLSVASLAAFPMHNPHPRASQPVIDVSHVAWQPSDWKRTTIGIVDVFNESIDLDGSVPTEDDWGAIVNTQR